jgi:hypothetical protein
MKRGTSLEKVPGIGKAIAKKLMKAGIYNADVLAYTDSNSLWEQTKIYEDKCRRYIEAAKNWIIYICIKDICKMGFDLIYLIVSTTLDL